MRAVPRLNLEYRVPNPAAEAPLRGLTISSSTSCARRRPKQDERNGIAPSNRSFDGDRGSCPQTRDEVIPQDDRPVNSGGQPRTRNRPGSAGTRA